MLSLMPFMPVSPEVASWGDVGRQLGGSLTAKVERVAGAAGGDHVLVVA